ncbi:hypothetical protein CAC42_6225 [Sphaceloma murrayae]|uniref:Uncharacterized protein n=1 Tax=Sphaceloma murrayae TaxID=2082308 RepID=A0A2K1QTL0_9PEZI|nr:hypothetical protein CAC42_6225 [Sphaceloma murrayae]
MSDFPPMTPHQVTLPTELLSAIIETSWKNNEPSDNLAGLTYSIRPAYLLPGDCTTLSRDNDTFPAICQHSSRAGVLAMHLFLTQKKANFVLGLANFDAHALRHAVKSMRSYIQQSGSSLREVQIYFSDCGRHVTPSNIAKWFLFCRHFAPYLSSSTGVHFSAPFCSEGHPGLDVEEKLIKQIKDAAVRGAAQRTDDTVDDLEEILMAFMRKLRRPKFAGLRDFEDLVQESTQGTLRRTLERSFAMYDLKQGDNLSAWDGRCPLPKAPRRWDIVPAAGCRDYFGDSMFSSDSSLYSETNLSQDYNGSGHP